MAAGRQKYRDTAFPDEPTTRASALVVTPARFLRRVLRWAFYVLGSVGLIWIGGMIWFAASMPKAVTDTTTKTDAIVVLTGGSGRLEAGVALLDRGLAPTLFLSGVNPRVRREDILRLAGNPPARLAERIVLGYRAEHTRGNAVETGDWVRQNNVGSVRVVTANYHMRRSLLELGDVVPGVRLIPNPVFPRGVGRASWWRSRSAMTIVVREYNKYLAAVTRQILG